MTMTAKMWEHLEKIAAAEDERAAQNGRIDGFAGRGLAYILWPDSPGWYKVSRRGSTPAGGAMGATMPMKGARAGWALQAEGYLGVRKSLSQNVFYLTEAGRRALAQRLSAATE